MRSWQALIASVAACAFAAGTPPAVLKRLESQLVQIAASAEMKEQMSRQGLEAHGAGSAELAKLLKTEIVNYKSVFKTAGIKME